MAAGALRQAGLREHHAPRGPGLPADGPGVSDPAVELLRQHSRDATAMSVSPGAEFDAYSETYEEALQRGLSVSGENAAYFARGRVSWLARCLSALHHRPESVLDFGCGTGTTTPQLLELLDAEQVVGVDVSAGALAVARRDHSSN